MTIDQRNVVWHVVMLAWPRWPRTRSARSRVAAARGGPGGGACGGPWPGGRWAGTRATEGCLRWGSARRWAPRRG